MHKDTSKPINNETVKSLVSSASKSYDTNEEKEISQAELTNNVKK